MFAQQEYVAQLGHILNCGAGQSSTRDTLVPVRAQKIGFESSSCEDFSSTCAANGPALLNIAKAAIANTLRNPNFAIFKSLNNSSNPRP